MAEPIDTNEPTAAEHAADMAQYMRGGERRAATLGNRGPMRFSDDGALHPDILDAYWRTGFYVFEGVIGAEELGELRADIDYMLERAPVHKGAEVDAEGRQILGLEFERDSYTWIAPLSDPVGSAPGFHPGAPGLPRCFRRHPGPASPGSNR